VLHLINELLALNPLESGQVTSSRKALRLIAIAGLPGHVEIRTKAKGIEFELHLR